MTKRVVIISEGSLDSFYEQTLQYIGDKYHNYPTALKGKPVGKGQDPDLVKSGRDPGVNTGKRIF